jgi:hypothetical protein
MRLWTVHPKYLDARGLVALWREGLLAQRVLQGGTRGYRHHPQLIRFRARRSPIACIAAYLREVHAESLHRGYRFDAAKITAARPCARMPETAGQVTAEWAHLKRKLRTRAPRRYREIARIARPDPHPLFHIVPGDARDWERARSRRAAPPASAATDRAPARGAGTRTRTTGGGRP